MTHSDFRNRLWRWGLLATIILAFLWPAAMSEVRADQRPNIIFVFTDDHAQHAISAYGSVINQTPHMDRLARQGMLFRDVFVGNSICAPSRATLLTGKHSHLNGQLTNRERFDGQQQTFPKLLHEAGYTTAMVGKWHLQSDPTGFDHWDILPGQGSYYNPDFITAEGRHRVEGYVTDIITDKCIQWLEEGRDPDKPFLLMYHHKAPHREWMPGPDHLTLYDGIQIPEPPTLFDDYATRGTAAREQEMEIRRHMFLGYDLKVPPQEDSPQREWQMWKHNDYHRMNDEQRAAWDAAYGPKNQAFRDAQLDGDDLLRWMYQRYIKDYLRTIASVDDNLGRMREYLEQAGLAENTIVIYTSDQGFYLGDHGWYDKRFIYEPSLRTPMIIHWPGVTDGTENTDMVSNLDWAPTMLDMAGVPVPDDMQGRSLVPLLKGNSPDDWRTSVYYHYYEFPAVHMVNRHYGARTARYKIAHFYELKEWELYDLQADPHELNNVYGSPEYAEVQAEMKAELARLQKYYRDDDPYISPERMALRRSLHRLKDVPLQQVVAYESNQRQTRGDLDPAFKPITLGARAVPEGDGVLLAQGGAHMGYVLYLADGVPTFALRSGGQLLKLAADTEVPQGQPVHLAAVLDDRAQMHLYVDGQRVASEQGGILTAKPNVAFHVGRDPSSPIGDYDAPFEFQGDLSDIRVYWGVLGEEELRRWAQQAQVVDMSKPIARAELLIELPERYNTPDALCLMANGDVIVTVPNVNDRSSPPALLRIKPDNSWEEFYQPPPHPVTGQAFPFGVATDPDGDLFLADLQWFVNPEDPGHHSRVLWIPMQDGKPGEAKTIIEGLVTVNAVLIRDGYLYLTDTIMKPGTDPLISGIFRFPLDQAKENPIRATLPLEDDPHCIGTIETHNVEVGFGADGLAMDKQGNLYIGNYADGTIHKIEFDADGTPQAPTIFAKAPFMKTADGLFYDAQRDVIFVADMMGNAIQMVFLDGTVRTLARDPASDGSGGRLSAPSEAVVRGDELIVCNFDMVIPGGVNEEFGPPHTISVIKLPPSLRD